MNAGRIAVFFAVFLTLVLPATNALAEEVGSLYTAQAPLHGNNTASRNEAYADALAQVLARVSGAGARLKPAQIATLFPDPAHYVLQYRPGEDNTLWVTFDGNAINRVLTQANLSVWGSNRPLTLIWLAVDWGQGEREIVAADDSDGTAGEQRSIDRNRLLRERIQEAALQRGIPIAFPLLDAIDREKVSFSDVWGGFDDLLLQASRRYGANSILVGRIRPSVADRNRWSYYFGGEQREWTGEPEAVIDLLGDMLAAQFAVSGGDQLDTFGLTVTGIDSVAAYAAVQSFMEKLDVIEVLTVDTVSGGLIRYRIQARGGKERLRRVLEFSSMLEPAGQFDDPAATGANRELDPLAFRYRR